MCNINEKKKKSGVSETQKEALLSYLEENLPVARNQFTSGVDGANELQKHWKSLELLLNGLGGATKSPREWRKCWADLRNGTRKRFMAEKAKRGRSGINEMMDTLSPFDRRVIGIVSIEAIDGDKSVEQGFSNMLASAPNISASSPDILGSEEAGPSHVSEVVLEVVTDSNSMENSAISFDVPETANLASRQRSPTAARAPSLAGRSNRLISRACTRSRDEEETEMIRTLMTIKKRKLDILEESHEMNKKEHELRIELIRAKINALSRQN